jgi:hypothetical protein
VGCEGRVVAALHLMMRRLDLEMRRGMGSAMRHEDFALS